MKIFQHSDRTPINYLP